LNIPFGQIIEVLPAFGKRERFSQNFTRSMQSKSWRSFKILSTEKAAAKSLALEITSRRALNSIRI
jgi:hypothetical protein